MNLNYPLSTSARYVSRTANQRLASPFKTTVPSYPDEYHQRSPLRLDPSSQEDLNMNPESIIPIAEYTKLHEKYKSKSRLLTELKTVLQEYMQKSKEQQAEIARLDELYHTFEEKSRRNTENLSSALEFARAQEAKLTDAQKLCEKEISIQVKKIEEQGEQLDDLRAAIKLKEQENATLKNQVGELQGEIKAKDRAISEGKGSAEGFSEELARLRAGLEESATKSTKTKVL